MVDSPTVSAAVVAAEIRRHEPSIGRAKLHKLLYYVQGHHLVWQHRPAFSDDIEAWEMGPVVASLWRAEKHRRQVGGRAQETLPETVRYMVGYMVRRYRGKTGAQLIDATHAEDPWRNAISGDGTFANQVIPHRSLSDHFSVEPPEVSLMREALDRERDDSLFVLDPPGALDALLAEYESA